MVVIGNRGCIGGDDGVGRDHGFEPGEQLLLRLQPLDDGLNDDIGLGDAGEVFGETDTIDRGPPRISSEAALLHLRLDHLGEVRLGRLGGAWLCIIGNDSHATLSGNLRNAATHSARADDAKHEIGGVGIEGHGRYLQPAS